MSDPNPNPSLLSQQQILQQVCDQTTERLRVDAEVTAVIGQVEVIITDLDDSIKIGDGTGTFVTETSIGSKNGLDVNIINSIPLPSGASTSALQTTGNTSLASIDSKTSTLGQKTMAGSSPVVIASDQSAIPISGAITGSVSVSGTVSTNQNALVAFQTSQDSVGTSSVQLAATPLTNRKSVSIKAITTLNTNIIYIGNSSGVTTSTGYPLFNGDSLQLDLDPTQSIYAISNAASQTVAVLELGS